MANTKSAKKMIRKIARRAEIRSARKSRIATFLRRAEEACRGGKRKEAEEAFLKAQSEIMRGASRKIMHKNRAARMVSSLARRVQSLR